MSITGSTIRSAKMKLITPPKLMPPCQSTAASGTLPTEQTKLTMATSGPTSGPSMRASAGSLLKKKARQKDSGTQAAKALRLPLGDAGASGSPYFSLVDLIKRWPEGPVRREILMVSDGIDRFGGGGPSNPYVDSAIEEAQRAGVIIYSIYSPGMGHYGHSFWRMNWGQNYLSQISDETGGESYYLGFGAPVSFAPYLDDLNHRLTRQYLLTFLAKPERKAGFQQFKLRTEVPNAELVAADRDDCHWEFSNNLSLFLPKSADFSEPQAAVQLSKLN